MSAHVLLNLLNKLRKSDKMQGFHNTGAGMLDSIYHMTLKLLKNAFLGWKRQYFATFTQR